MVANRRDETHRRRTGTTRRGRRRDGRFLADHEYPRLGHVDLVVRGTAAAQQLTETRRQTHRREAGGLLGRYLRRVTLGWGPERLAQLFVYYDSVLHSVREGLVLVDRNGDLVLYNDQAATLLGIPPRPAVDSTEHPPSLSAVSLPPSLGELLRSGRTAHDEIHVTDTRVLVVSQEPAVAPSTSTSRPSPTPMGFVATIRDHTDLQNLGRELQSMQTLSEALRAQTHEHSNRLHTIVSLMELGRTDQALDFATKDLELSQRLADEMLGAVDEPVISALIMGKSAQANELGVHLTVTASGTLAQSGLSIQDLVTVLGNLVDNALDAAAAGTDPRWVSVMVSSTEPAVVIEVADSGSGVAPDVLDDVLRLGFSTKGPPTSSNHARSWRRSVTSR